ncbi:hypothetical protein F5Y12DRAFT_213516 [Xylaria sp. FL1777]|nr:hypothetical protein F5Y12DRAFT_213516 [Xylaria sp. FL1777]
MEASIKIVSKGVMMGAAIMFTAVHREHTSYNYVTLGLFSFGTVAHVAMSLSVATLILYILLAVLLPTVLVAVAVFQPQFIPLLGYAPVITAFALWIIEDCSHLSLGASCLRPWWAKDIDIEPCTPSASRTMICENTLGFPASVVPDYRIDNDDGSIMSTTQESILFRYMCRTSQSCVPSSRLSDISLSSSGLDSLPSSWGTLTRSWFPEFSAQGHFEFDEPGHAGYRTARTV